MFKIACESPCLFGFWQRMREGGDQEAGWSVVTACKKKSLNEHFTYDSFFDCVNIGWVLYGENCLLSRVMWLLLRAHAVAWRVSSCFYWWFHLAPSFYARVVFGGNCNFMEIRLRAGSYRLWSRQYISFKLIHFGLTSE